MASSTLSNTGRWPDDDGWDAGGPPSWSSTVSASSERDADRLAEELAAAWRRGERVAAEEVIARHPGLGDRPEVALRLIYEEVCQRQDRGEPAPAEELFRRFPAWRVELGALLESHQALEPWLATPRWPGPGEPLGDFALLDELGRGARGRVYLAAQPKLADRPVVLKVTPSDGTEHLSLARLQHTHIVPLYSVEEFPGAGLRALCMPYLGGVVLARLLDGWRDRPARRRSGADFVAALDAAEAGAVVRPDGRGPARQFLGRASYVRAVCWIGACLADALQYAHERGLLHLDIKPSNVLIAADGQPMLLDFHLARGPIGPADPAPERLGGTYAYMAPEQREALADLTARRPIAGRVDGRADVFSLGRILYELLGGPARPPRGGPRPRLRRCNPEVSPGLEAIVENCLADDPNGRYPTAGALASDLRRHLADLPLAGVPNRSVAERWRKWRRRRPHTAGWLAALAVASAALVWAGVVAAGRAERRLDEARAALSAGEDQLRRGHCADAVQTLRRGLSCASGFPGDRRLRLALGHDLRAAQRACAARRLAETAERARFFRDPGRRSPEELRSLEAACRSVWEARGQIERLGDETSGGDRSRVEADLVDVVALLAELRARDSDAAPGGRASGRSEALALLDELEREVGPDLVIDLERVALAGPEGAAAAAARATAWRPRTAREYEALGRDLLRRGALGPAADAFDRAIEREPNAFWPNFSQGLCAYRAHRYEDAAAAFRVCIALEPEAVPCYFNRALAYTALGQVDRALGDYDRALARDPGHAESRLNRGILRLRRGRVAEAISDLERALRLGADAISAHYHLALAERARGASGAADGHLRAILRRDPLNRDARALLDRLREDARPSPRG